MTNPRSAEHRTRSVTIDVFLVAGIGFYILMSCFMLTQFPRVWTDTAWTCVAPYHLYTEGQLANPMMPYSGYDEHILAPQVLPRIVLAGVYEVFGFGLVQSRAVSVVCGLILLLVTYWFANKHFGRWVGRLAFLLLMTDTVFFVTSRTVRADIFLACVAVGGIFVFIDAVSCGKPIGFAISGFLMGLSLYTHPNSVLVLAPIVLIFLREDGLKVVSSRNFWFFSCALLIAVSPYILYVVVSDVQNHFRDFFGQLEGRTTTSFFGILANYAAEYERYFDYIFFPKRVFIFMVQLAAVVYAVRRGSRVGRLLVLQVGVFCLLLPMWNSGNHTARYFIAVIPSLSVLVSSMIVSLFNGAAELKSSETGTRRWRRVLVTTIIAVFLGNQLAGDIYLLWRYRSYDYDRMVQSIRSVIPEGKRTWGAVAFWIGLHDYPFRSQLTPTKNVKEFEPEYAILYDVDIWGDKSATAERQIGERITFKSRGEAVAKDFREKGELVAVIEDDFHGRLEIWRMRGTTGGL